MPRKVLYIHHGSEKGGAPLSLLYTILGVRDQGYLPLVGLVKPNLNLHKLYNDHGIQTVELSFISLYIFWSSSNFPLWHYRAWLKIFKALRYWFSGQKKFSEFLKQHQFDFIHLNSMALSSIAQLLIRSKIPFVWHIREFGPKYKDFRFRFLQSLMLKCDQLIFLSYAEQKSWMEHRNHGHVIHNFLDEEKISYNTITSNTHHSDLSTILYVGGLKEIKGILLLIDILLILKSKFIQFQCLMPNSLSTNEINPSLGNQPFEDKILHLIQQNGLQENCKRLPFNPVIWDLFRASDVHVFPALYPHFARPVVEASAVGIPSVVANFPSLDELVLDGKTGYLVNPLSAQEYADKIELIFNNKMLKNSLGAQANLFFKENFSATNQIKKVINVYKTLQLK